MDRKLTSNYFINNSWIAAPQLSIFVSYEHKYPSPELLVVKKKTCHTWL